MNIKYSAVLLLPVLLALGACSSDKKTTPATSSTPPDVPTAPTLALSELEIALTWTAVTGAATYEVHRHTADTVADATKLSDSVTEASYTDSSDAITAGNTYYYWLKACNANGCSAVSASANVRVPEGAVARTFEIVITNLMAGETPPVNPRAPRGQVLSPYVVIAHGPGWSAFTEGKAASVALEQLAEDGVPSFVQADAQGNAANHQASKTSSLDPLAPGIILPGASDTMTLETTAVEVSHLTVLTKLTRTNDGFTGINAELVSDLAVDESRTYFSPAWDAGTENNLETMGTLLDDMVMNGFDAARDDVTDVVTVHPGVITALEGLPNSILGDLERFDNPVLRIVVKRTK